MEKDNQLNPNSKTHYSLKIREMEIDDIPEVFHLGEILFEAQSLPNLYRTWDEFEVVELFLSDPEFCIVAEFEEVMVGFALGTDRKSTRLNSSHYS